MPSPSGCAVIYIFQIIFSRCNNLLFRDTHCKNDYMKTILNPWAKQLHYLRYSRLIYTGLLFAAIVLLFLKDWQNGFSMLGISLVVTPSNYRITWAGQPLWRHSWRIIHLMVLFAAMAYLIISKL
jgi:hypothetical protein